jgi:hypothetical protein
VSIPLQKHHKQKTQLREEALLGILVLVAPRVAATWRKKMRPVVAG